MLRHPPHHQPKRTLEYAAPSTFRNRETDYAAIRAMLDATSRSPLSP